MVVKINKQKLIMEEVEQFDNISLEDLAEGLDSCLFAYKADADNTTLSVRAT